MERKRVSWQDDLYNANGAKRSFSKVGVKGILRANKYKAKKVVTDDAVFDSEKEYNRWCDLKLLESAGQIRNLERQIEYRLEVRGVLIRKYTLDHRYEEDGQIVHEDVKGGYRLPADWPLVKKLMRAIHGIEIQEWPGRKRKARKKREQK